MAAAETERPIVLEACAEIGARGAPLAGGWSLHEQRVPMAADLGATADEDGRAHPDGYGPAVRRRGEGDRVGCPAGRVRRA